MFGKVEKCIDPITGQEGKQAVTLSGPAEGIVSKVAYCCDIDYNMVLENGGVGSGYVGLSTCRPITYNPWCCLGDDDEGNPIHKGVLTVDYIKAGEIEGAGCSELVYQHQYDNNLNYSIPIWGNAALVDNYGELGISNAYPLYYNPVTSTVTALCYKAGTTLTEETGITFSCNSFSISGNGNASQTITPTSVISSAQGANVVLSCNSLAVTTPRVTMAINSDSSTPDITAGCVCYYLDSKVTATDCGSLCLKCMCFACCGYYTKAGEIGYSCSPSGAKVCVGCNYACLCTVNGADFYLHSCCALLRSNCGIHCFGNDYCIAYNGQSTCAYKWCSTNGLFYKKLFGDTTWYQYNPIQGGIQACVCSNTLYITI